MYSDLKSKIQEFELAEKLNELSTIPLKDIPKLISEEGFGKFILPLFEFILKNCIELEEATSIKMFPDGVSLYYISFNTKKPLPSDYEKPEYTNYEPAYSYDLAKYEPQLDRIKASKRSKHIERQNQDFTTFLWESKMSIFMLLDKYEDLFIETFPEILLGRNPFRKTTYKDKMINLFQFFEKNNNHQWLKSLMNRLRVEFKESEFEEVECKLNKVIDLNLDLQIDNKSLETKLKHVNKPKKKDILKEHKSNHNQESWDDVKLLFFESSNNYSYITLDGLKPLPLAGKRKELLHLILKSDDLQLDSSYHHDKATFSRLKKDLKEMFNKELDPLKWNKSSRVFKIKFTFKIYQDSNEYKTMLLTQGIESKLQCNLEEFEN